MFDSLEYISTCIQIFMNFTALKVKLFSIYLAPKGVAVFALCVKCYWLWNLIEKLFRLKQYKMMERSATIWLVNKYQDRSVIMEAQQTSPATFLFWTKTWHARTELCWSKLQFVTYKLDLDVRQVIHSPIHCCKTNCPYLKLMWFH